jgi:flavin-dependent dehydrogenase
MFTQGEFLGFDPGLGESSIRVRLDGEEIRVKAKFLISADGVNSRIRRDAGLKPIQKVPLLQAEIDLPGDWNEGTTKVWFNVDDTPYFYWLIPDKNRKAVVGLIAESGKDIKRLLDGFLTRLEFKALSYQSGAAALHAPGVEVESKIGGMQVYFTGDAGGQVKVTTVGGTVTGLFGGKAAAEAILTGESYRKRLRSVQRELDLHYFIRNLLEKMSAADYQKLIRSITPPVQNLLSSHDRDGMRSHFWKLPILQPGFIPLGIKLLLK